MFKKHYKSHLKNITYKSLHYGYSGSAFYGRNKLLIDEYRNNNNEKYDLYLFMRIDCIFLKKINIHDYVNTLDENMVKLICRDEIFPNRFDHNRDFDMGIVSKNIDNIYKWITYDFKHLIPQDIELKENAKKINCINIFTLYDLPLPKKEEQKYKSSWQYLVNCRAYSFDKLIAPLRYEDNFVLSILR